MKAETLEWVDTEDFLTALEVRNLTKSGREYTFSCPSGNHAHGDATPSAGMNATTTLWRCRNPACGVKGNAADFLCALKGYTRSESMRILQERYGGPEISAEPGALKREVERIRRVRDHDAPHRTMIPEDEYLDRFGVHWRDDQPHAPYLYMTGRGFTAETLNKWKIGYDDYTRRITIPVYDVYGKLVGIKGRSLDDVKPKYISIGDADGRAPRYGFQTYMKSMHVFGLDRSIGGRVIIVEGELNAMALHQMGFQAVAVAGSEFSDAQADLICRAADVALIYFDGDEAGRAGTALVAEKINPYLLVTIVEAGEFDPGDALDPTKRWSPSDVVRELNYARSYLASSLLS